MLGNHVSVDPDFATFDPGKLGMEYASVLDILDLIRWPYLANCGWGSRIACDHQLFYAHMSRYWDLFSSKMDPLSFESLLEQCSRTDEEKCDDSMLKTSADAWRHEEDCLLESLPSSVAGANNYSSSGASIEEHFLCQKNSMTDMTLAELNSGAYDLSHEVKVALTETESSSATLDLRTLSKIFVGVGTRTAAVGSRTEGGLSEAALLKRNTCVSNQPSFPAGDEMEDRSILKREIKTEPSVVKKTALKRPKPAKRPRPSSSASDRCAAEDMDWKQSPKKTIHSLPGSAAAASVEGLLPLDKKIKLEVKDGSYDKSMNNSSQATSKVSDRDSMASDVSEAESVFSQVSSTLDQQRTNLADKRYFWQYNMQAKGPKEKRLCKNFGASDPHILREFEDPVFDPGQIYFVHSGKARKGDGTDITPNPEKLMQIGAELKSLNGVINNMMQMTDSGSVARVTTMKEKNKFASRVCRLKKKAQHEANKIKLQGLNEEHNQLMKVLSSIKSKLKRYKTRSSEGQRTDFTQQLDTVMKACLNVTVAGHADDYVSSVLLSSSTGDRKEVWLYSD